MTLRSGIENFKAWQRLLAHLILSALSLSIGTFTWAQEPGLSKLRIGADLLYLQPYNCDEALASSCIFPEILKQALAPLGYSFTFLPIPEARKYAGMANGDLHGAVIFTTESLTADSYPDSTHICPTPIVSTFLSAFVHRDNDIDISSSNDLSNYHLIALRLPEFQRNMIGLRNFKNVTRTKSAEQMIRILLARRGDYFLFEKHSTFHMLDQKNLNHQILWKKDITKLDYHVAISNVKLSTQPDLLKVCDSIDKLARNGRLAAIIESYTNPIAIEKINNRNSQDL
jgi:hypothetical protein